MDRFRSGLRPSGGGDAVRCFPAFCIAASDGGHGLVAEDSTVRLLQTDTIAGQGGFAFPDCAPCGNGKQGRARILRSSTLTSLPGTRRSYQITPAVVPAGSATLTAAGVEGDVVTSLVGLAPDDLYLPQHCGPQLVAPPLTVVVEGSIPAGGILTKTIELPPVPALAGFALSWRQGFFFAASGNAILGSGSAVVLR